MIEKLFAPCLFHLLTGWYCPGCGGTRAVKYLLAGKIGMSFQYHPLVLYAAVVLGAELISWVLSKLCRRPGLFLGHGTELGYLAAVIVLINWIVKNVCLIVFGIDLLSVPLF